MGLPVLLLSLVTQAPPSPTTMPAACAAAAEDAAAAAAEGFRLYDTDQYEPARRCFELARTVAERTGDTRSEAEAHRGLGRVLFRQGSYPAAEEELGRALRLFEGVHDRLGQARTESHLGSVAMQRGEPLRARPLYLEARRILEELGPSVAADTAQLYYNLYFVLEDASQQKTLLEDGARLARESGNRRLEGRFFNLAGDAAYEHGDYAGALAAFEKARDCFEAAQAKEALARVLISMARLQLAHGEARKCAELAETALGIQQEIGDPRGAALSLDFLATANARLGRHRQALAYYDRALDSARGRGDDRLVKMLLLRSAESHLSMGAHARAAALLERSLKPPVERSLEENGYELLARARLGLGQAVPALLAAEKAVALARERDTPLFAPLETRARALRRLGRTGEALTDVREAIDVVERTRGRLIPADFLRQGFAERHQALFGLAIDLLHRLGRPAEALEAAELARARAFLDLLATRADPSPAPDRPPAGQALPAPLTAPEIAAVAGALGSSVLSYWVDPEATFVWVVDRTGVVRMRRVAVPADRLARLVRTTCAAPVAWKEGRAADTGVWRELYDLLIAPVAPSLPRTPGGLLTIVPHGPLFALSFAALRDEGGRYLVERYAIHYVPAAAVLRFTARAPDQAASRRPRYLLVADPSALPAASRLPPLPASRQEVAAIRRTLGGRDVTVLRGDEAREDAVRSLLAEETVVHFATHGIVRDERPMESFLALGAGGPSGQDGRLTAGEVYDLRLAADLVFLSACRSGQGRVTGDGLLGLTRAFLSAGASSVIATLWEVADQPASKLVPPFYESYALSGGKSRSLRAAQLRLLKLLRAGGLKVATPQGPVALPEDPVLWAGFVLVGQP